MADRAYPPEYVSKATLAYLLDCGERTIDDYVARRLIPEGIKLGGLRRWHWPAIREMLDPIQNDADPIRRCFSEGVRRVAQKAAHD